MSPSKREGKEGHRVLCSHNDLADFNASQQAVGLAESATHTSLQTICAGARQHFVDAENVVGVDADAQVKVILAGHLREGVRQ